MNALMYAWDDGGRRETYPDWPASVGDCAIRGMAIYTGRPYGDVYRECNDSSRNRLDDRVSRAPHRRIGRRDSARIRTGRYCDNGTMNPVWKGYLMRHGVICVWMATPGRRGLTAEDAFAMFGDCILLSHGGNGSHLVAIKGGKLRDTWNGLVGKWTSRGTRKVLRYSQVWIREDLINESARVTRHVDTDYEDRPVPETVKVKFAGANFDLTQRLSQVAELQRQIDALMS